jgi:prepilin-type processing-associated H-X9-DG protein
MSESDAEEPQPLDYANPRDRPARTHDWILLFIFCPAVLLLLAAIVLPRFSRPISHAWSSPRLFSQSNLRQIGQGILLYTNDHNGDYPDSFAIILLNEDVTSAEFVSPSRSETPAAGPTTQAIAAQLVPGPHLSYVYLGRGLSANTVTPDTIVAYELINPDGTNLLFGDGHVEFFDGPETAKIMAKVSCGKFPVTMPSH